MFRVIADYDKVYISVTSSVILRLTEKFTQLILSSREEGNYLLT